MALSDKVAYIKGLMDGLKLDETKDEVKVLRAITDVLDEIVDVLDENDSYIDFLDEKVDEIDEDLGDVEEIVYDDFDMCDDCSQDCESCYGCCDSEYLDDPIYEVTCKCGEKICVDEDTLLEGEVICPQCGEVLEFDFSDFENDECDCGCCDHDHFDEDLMS